MPAHLNTPKRARMRGTVAFLRHKKMIGKGPNDVKLKEIFEFFGVSERQGREILAGRVPGEESEYDDRMLNHDERFEENRHAVPVITEEEIEIFDESLETMGEEDPDSMYDAMRAPWTSSLDTEASESTVDKHMRKLGWTSRIETTKEENPESTQKQREQRAIRENEGGWWRDPNWRKRVYTADKWHFSLQQERTGRVKRKPEHSKDVWTVQRRPNTVMLRSGLDDEQLQGIITNDEPSTKRRLRKRQPKKTGENVTQLHAVAVIGLNYKSHLYWYDMPTNNNGKLDSAMYIKVYSEVFTDIKKHHGSDDFLLWEDGDGTHTSNDVKQWKKDKGYTCIPNAHYCPETAPIEDVSVANVVKIETKTVAAENLSDLKKLAEAGWAKVKIKSIENIYEDMQKRWKDLELARGARINR